ncbi:MAG: DNA replication complex GINS family protein [Methanosarcinales archaeon]|nr:MAG: DNA replication complex GINS family protein [Methanosarcinales archaeon]
MDFEELRNTLKQEQKSKLAKLEPDFYESVRTYLDGLRDEQKTASGKEAQFLTDELATASDRLQRIFNLRIGKIVNLASLSIMGEIGGIKQDINMMTQVERDIYDSVLGAVRHGWVAVEQAIAGESVVMGASVAPSTPVAHVTPVTPVTPVTSAAQVPPVESAPSVPEAVTGSSEDEMVVGGVEGFGMVSSSAPDGYTIVRVLKNIPTFVGTDSCHYTLAKNDVVTLPDLHATVLCKRRAVLPVKMPGSPGAINVGC